MRKLIGLFSLLLLSLLVGCKEVSYEQFQFDVEGFNSTIIVQLVTEKSADEFADLIVEIKEVAYFYHKISDKRNEHFDDDNNKIVNIYEINKNPSEKHFISDELFGLLELSIEYHEKTNGYFNIALSPVIEVWDSYKEQCQNFYSNEKDDDKWWEAYYKTCTTPSQAELEAKKPFTNVNNITLNKAEKSIQMQEGMSLDLGAVAKGYVTQVINEMMKTKFSNYIINSGRSSITLSGSDVRYKNNHSYNIKITDPSSCYPGLFCTKTYYDLNTTNISIGTSGDYQDCYIISKNTDFTEYDLYHHIINPNTLRPERYSRSVTILIDNPAIADIYSTALFAMPVSEAIALVNNISGAEATIYDINGKVHTSSNFSKLY